MFLTWEMGDLHCPSEGLFLVLARTGCEKPEPCRSLDFGPAFPRCTGLQPATAPLQAAGGAPAPSPQPQPAATLAPLCHGAGCCLTFKFIIFNYFDL